jgi:hypothetical protein
MSKPILEIFADVSDMGVLDEGPGEWPAMIERNAPGYLALEAEGRGAEFNHSHFSDRNGYIGST